MKQKISNTIEQIEPPVYLKEAVLLRVKMAQQREIKRRKTMFIVGFIFSGISLIMSVAIFGKEILSSEFWSIALLGLTDMQVVLMSWQEYGLSLLETFPSIAFASLAAPIFIALILMKKYAEVEQDIKLNLNFN